MPRLAIYTFGILREPPDHEQLEGFFDLMPSIFSSAEQLDRGYREVHSRVETTGAFPHFFETDKHPGASETLSLWDGLESAYAFTYFGPHAEALERRNEWLVPPRWPSYVIWWVPDDHVPGHEEAHERHSYLHEHGSSPRAFDFDKPFDAAGQTISLDRQTIRDRVASMG